MVHRGEPAAKHSVEGISVFVRVRPTNEQEQAGDDYQKKVRVYRIRRPYITKI